MPIADPVAAALGRGSARLSRRVPPVGYTVNAWSMFGGVSVCLRRIVRALHGRVDITLASSGQPGKRTLR